MASLFENDKVNCSAGHAIVVVTMLLCCNCAEAWAQQPKPTAPDATPPGGKPVTPNRPSGARGGFDTPPPGEAVRPAPDAAKTADTGGPSGHRPARTGVSTYPLGTGDVVRVVVFQLPDMTTETRVTEAGTLTIPLLGPIEVTGLNSREL